MIFQLVLAASIALSRHATPPQTQGQAPTQAKVQGPLRLKPGDVLKVVTTISLIKGTEKLDDPYQGDFQVQNDGSIYGVGFGRLSVQDKTVAQAQALIKSRMSRLLNPKEVSVTLKSQRTQFVFVVGNVGMKGGQLPIVGDLSLREALSTVNPEDNADELEAIVFRKGNEIARRNLAKMLDATAGEDVALQADDVISVVPLARVRIWVNGAVRMPGRVRVPAGTRLAEALSAAGGPAINDSFGLSNRSEYSVSLQRGASIQTFWISDPNQDRWPVLEAGDVVYVTPPTRFHVAVAGEVPFPGDIEVKPGTTVQEAIVQRGGPTREGTLTNVLVLRDGARIVVDARLTAASSPERFQLKAGDLIVVQKNRRLYYVYGEVARQGEVLMPDDKKVTAIDALSAAGGIGTTGTLRRLFVSRVAPDGTSTLRKFNLDDFIKKSDPKANPEILPGDILLFSKSEQTTVSVAGQLLNTFVLLSALRKF